MSKNEVSEFAEELYRMYQEAGGCWCGFAERLLEEIGGEDEVEYRLLEAGEVIQEGDEVLLEEGWRSAKHVVGNRIQTAGSGILPEGYYRRPVKSPVGIVEDMVQENLGQRLATMQQKFDEVSDLAQLWRKRCYESERRLEQIKKILP